MYCKDYSLLSGEYGLCSRFFPNMGSVYKWGRKAGPCSREFSELKRNLENKTFKILKSVLLAPS